LLALYQRRHWGQLLVFAKTKKGCDELVASLLAAGIAADAIHGDRPQASRLKALTAFKAGTVQVLVATDVAARGIDIHGLPQVLNFDLPLQAEDYIHRIGRTGRAGASGEAISLVCADEMPQLAAIEALLQTPLPREEEADFAPLHKLPASGDNNKPGKSGDGKRQRGTPSNWEGFDDFPENKPRNRGGRRCG